MPIIKATNVKVEYNGEELPLGEPDAHRVTFDFGSEIAYSIALAFEMDTIAGQRFALSLRLARFLPLRAAAWLAEHWPAWLLAQRVAVWVEERQLEIGTAFLKYWRFVRRGFR